MTTPDERLTVGTYLERWLDEQEAVGRIRASTLKNYRSYVRLHLVPGLGNLSLAKLTPTQLQSFISSKLAGGCSPHTVRYLRVVLRAALERALKKELVARNVAKLVEVPPATKTDVVPLTREEAQVLVAGMHNQDRE